MKLKIFTVYDSKTEAYLSPFYLQSTGAALRSFEEVANNPESNIGKHPADYTLFEIGTFEDYNCKFELLDARINLGCAIEHVTAPRISTEPYKGEVTPITNIPKEAIK